MLDPGSPKFSDGAHNIIIQEDYFHVDNSKKLFYEVSSKGKGDSQNSKADNESVNSNMSSANQI